jgi:hypothetical protein
MVDSSHLSISLPSGHCNHALWSQEINSHLVCNSLPIPTSLVLLVRIHPSCSNILSARSVFLSPVYSFIVYMELLTEPLCLGPTAPQPIMNVGASSNVCTGFLGGKDLSNAIPSLTAKVILGSGTQEVNLSG